MDVSPSVCVPLYEKSQRFNNTVVVGPEVRSVVAGSSFPLFSFMSIKLFRSAVGQTHSSSVRSGKVKKAALYCLLLFSPL